MSKTQREKGKRGEREVAELLRRYGFAGRRTSQYCGNTGDASDVVGIDGMHIEVKRCERTEIGKWMAQAVHDCGDNVPVVFHRRSREAWLVTLNAEDFLKIITGGTQNE